MISGQFGGPEPPLGLRSLGFFFIGHRTRRLDSTENNGACPKLPIHRPD